MNNRFSLYQIHAYMDGEMSPHEIAEFEQKLATNPTLKAELCELTHNKRQVHQHYSRISPPKLNLPRLKSATQFSRIAASILLGALLGSASLYSYQTLNPLEIKVAINDAATPVATNFVVHLDTNQPDKLAATLEKARYLLDTRPDAQVEIIANHEGIQLFDASLATSNQVMQLLSQYDNLHLMACQRTVERLEKQGEAFHLLHKVRADSPAVDEVVAKMKQGWTYIKI
ncbi:MAG: hypothetical protein IBX48_05430 [Thiomicrospira sp.]|uniref:hypothetical protein n=1 Tax=Thiomicrospira sp. TaxID=935 RepID=UPI0019F530C1|nr:hypothetical protein [Thiomicrospira sp.]MBE0493765.1 hypothetical protein [Thiomicrospira sp.]